MIKSGIKEIDNIFNGFKPGELVYIFSGGSEFKSTFLNNIITHNINNNKNIITFEFESKELLLKQYASLTFPEALQSWEDFIDDKTGIGMQKHNIYNDKINHVLGKANIKRLVIPSAVLGRPELDYLKHAFICIKESEITGLMYRPKDIIRYINFFVGRHKKIEAVFLDAFQHINHSQDGRNPALAATGKNSFLKELAVKYNIPVIVSSRVRKFDTEKGVLSAPAIKNMLATADKVIILSSPESQKHQQPLSKGKNGLSRIDIDCWIIKSDNISFSFKFKNKLTFKGYSPEVVFRK